MRFLNKFFKKIRGPKFKIGQTVKCIDDRYHIIIYAKEYKVLDVIQLTCCGDWAYDVGLKCETYSHCNDCKKDIPGHTIRWVGEFRLAPIISDEVSEEMSESEEIKIAQESILKQTKEILEKEYIQN